MTHVSDDTLNDFIAGTLPDKEMQDIEAILNNDPALFARVEALSAPVTAELSNVVNAAVDSTLDSDVSAEIMDLLHEQETVVPIGAANKPTVGYSKHFQPAAIAASIAVAAVLSLMLLQPSPTGVSLPSHTVSALNNLPDGAQSGATVIGESYLNASDQFCRTFQLDGTRQQVGLACKSEINWQLVALIASPEGPAYLPAGSGAHPLLDGFTGPMRALEDGAEASYLSK